MSQGGTIDVTSSDPEIPTDFVTNSGTAHPSSNTLNIVGSNGVTTSGSGNTVNVTGINATAGATIGASQIGVSAFDSASFTVTNGFTSLSSGGSTVGQVLQSTGGSSIPVFSTATYPSTINANQILYSSLNNVISGLANGVTGQVLTANTGSPPSWAAASGGIPTIGSSTSNGIVTWSGTGGAAVLSTATTVSAAGIVNGPAGTAGAPTYSFTSDPDTGMFSDVANNIKFSTGGSNRATIGASGVFTSFGGVVVSSGNLTFAAGFIGIIRSVAGNITGATSDYCLNVTSTASARTVTVPNTPNSNQIFIIKDGSGAAATNNITVTTPGGVVTIDGSTTYPINTNWGSVTLIFDGSNYLIIGKS